MPNSDEIIAHGNIERMFTYHSPTLGQVQRYQAIREAAKQLGHTMLNCCPGSRERSAAITLLQNAVMMANAAIAINEKDQNEAAQVGKAIVAKAQEVTEKLQALRRVVENDPDFDPMKTVYPTPTVDPNK